MSWRDYVRRVEPYEPGEQPTGPGVIKLNTNECPYPPSPEAVRALRELDAEGLRLYPDPDAKVLREAVADYHGISGEQVFVGVGSDDVLAMCFLTFFQSDGPVLFPDITYSFYDVWAKLFGIPYETVKLDGEFQIRPEDYRRDNTGVIFPNPNAPTGVLQPLAVIEDILVHNRDKIVIVDEAYIDFGGESALPLIEEFDNLLVVQTLSKSRALAGLRIGCAMGNRELIRHLEDVKFSFNSYTMNLPALCAGAAAMGDRAYFEEITGKIVATRERVKPEFARLGFRFADSRSNFLFVTHKHKKAHDIFKYLKSRDIYVRHFKKPRIDNYLRISMGTDREMDALLECLEDYL